MGDRLKTQPKRFHIGSTKQKMLNQTDSPKYHGLETIELDILHLEGEKKVADVEKSLLALKDTPFGANEDYMITSVAKVAPTTKPPTASPKSSPPTSQPSSGACVMPTLLGLFAAL